jgi:hypothetical protein
MEELLKELEREYGVVGYAVADSFRAVPPGGSAGQDVSARAVLPYGAADAFAQAGWDFAKADAV